jgi:hypothetical protein
MQFVANGPDIPNSLLMAHEEGRVVFFCGAGISFPAGLRGFDWLVEEIYRLVGEVRDPIEEQSFQGKQFDATLDHLERRIKGQRIAVRKALCKALKPNLRLKGATDTHSALLQLARNREGTLRLVTTNFDRIFDIAAKHSKLSVNAYSAPMLPIPKISRWDGLVYLHGVLPENDNDNALQRLVLTSGDFGLAYLTERWAARFVSELFRNYIVCFVGYSINDPVMRYMMDALAADRMMGEETPQAYAFGDFESGKELSSANEWKAKGVTPIPYERPVGVHEHLVLHHTLKAWAETYRDGILGKERIIVSHAIANPSTSTRQDDFVGRVLWALSDKDGLPAKCFAELNPVPPLSWLEVFFENRFGHTDLIRFGVPPLSKIDDKLRFNLLLRPAPYTHASWMSLASGGLSDSHWDSTMFHLARWLVRHLDDPTLIIWLAQQGSQLHERWHYLLEEKLNHFALLESEGKTEELESIRTDAPKAIPSPLMQTLWRLLLSGRVKSRLHRFDLYRWQERFSRSGLSTTLRLELRELLSPRVTIREPFSWPEDDGGTIKPERINDLVDWEIELTADDVYQTLNGLNSDMWREALPALLDDFQQLLRDTLDLRRELGADEHSDPSYWYLPSISPHWQNRRFHDWTGLIELVRDAWLATWERDPSRASNLAQGWFNSDYPTFKRLALFAASQDKCIASEYWVDWLLSDGAWWLWSVDTQRETMRLLVLQGANLTATAGDRLETAILNGPPRKMFLEDIEPERWKRLVNRSVWLHLAKLTEGGKVLGNAAARCFEGLSASYPDWELGKHERDEFPTWMSGTGDPDYEDSHEIDIAPHKRADLVIWLIKPIPEGRPFYEDNWFQTCRRYPLNCLFALSDLAQQEFWPVDRWRTALQAWGEKHLAVRSWRCAAPLVQTMPDHVLLEVIHSLTPWMKSVSGAIDSNDALFLDLCSRLLQFSYEDDVETDDPVFRAINHPVGDLTQALLNFWFRREPNDKDGVPVDIEPVLTRLCDTGISCYRHGRVLLGSRLIPLFRVDKSWTEAHLLPLFDWNDNAIEAKAAWEGFLWAPRLYPPLMAAFKDEFLLTANHFEDLGKHKRQFAGFLTYAALELSSGFTADDFRSAIRALPQEGLEQVAQALVQVLGGAGEQREEYWLNRIQPFWKTIWPKSHEMASDNIASTLARLCVAARGEFSSALTELVDWLKPIAHPYFVVNQLAKSGLAKRFPEDALRFLDALIDDQIWAPRELQQCLDEIAEAMPALKQDPRYIRLLDYVRCRRG